MDLSREEREQLALHLVPGIGPKLTAALLERFGSVPRSCWQRLLKEKVTRLPR